MQEEYALFQKFCNDIMHVNRFFVDEKIMKLFDRIISEHKFILNKNENLYRGRINKHNDTTPYVGDDIGMPKVSNITANGRANPNGINYMYLSSDYKTVIAELRPNIGAFISIGKFNLTEDCNAIELGDIATMGGNIIDEISSKFVATFLMYLQLRFSRPIDYSKPELEYLPTQFFSEYCKKKGIDVIIFLSSVMNETTEMHYNYVFFDSSKLKYISTDVYLIDGISYDDRFIGKQST